MQLRFFHQPNVNSHNTVKNLIRLFFIFQLIERVIARQVLAFSYNDTDYTVLLALKAEEHWQGQDVQKRFLTAFSDNLKNSDYSNVTWLNTTISAFDSLWNTSICKGEEYAAASVTFGRAIASFIQQYFEEFIIDILKKSSNSAHKTCDDRVDIVMGVIFGIVGVLILGIIVTASIACYLRHCGSCCQTNNRATYDNVDRHLASISIQGHQIALEPRINATQMPDEDQPILRR